MSRPPGYGRPSSRAGKKQIVVFLEPDVIGRLRVRARNEERTMQEVLAACMNEGLRPLGHPPLFPVEHRRMFVRSSRRAKPRGGEGRRDGLDSDRPACEGLRDDTEVAAVQSIEPTVVDVEHGQRPIRRLAVDGRGTRDDGAVAHPPEEPAGDARRAARAAHHLVGPFRRDADAEDARGARHDELQLLHGVELEPHGDAEPIAQGCAEKWAF